MSGGRGKKSAKWTGSRLVELTIAGLVCKVFEGIRVSGLLVTKQAPLVI